MYLASFCLLQGEGLAWLAARITRAARALETSKAVFHTLVEEAPIGIMIANSEGVFEVVNPALCALIGYSEAELIGQPFATVVPIEQRGALDQRFQERFIRAAREDDEALIPTKGGQSVHVLNIGIPLTALSGEAKRAFFILDITERKRAEQERAAVAEAMAEVSAALASALELQDLYALILQQVGKILPTDYAQILAPDENWLTVVAQHGTPPVAVGTRLFHGTQVLDNWLVLQQGRPILIRDTADDPDWRDIPPRVGPYRVRSLISIPLMLDTRLVGVFEVTSTTKDRYNDRHVQIATVFGERITQALRHVRLFEAEQERARAAEELARLRSDFVALVSHELRTPLTAIIGFTEMLQHYWERMPEARRRQQVDHIAEAAGRQQRLVEDLLLLSQAEDGPLTMETQVLPITPLIQEAVAELQGRYKDQRVRLDGPHDLEIRADSHRVRQILVSLLDNAAKYSPNQGTVEVIWRRQGAGVEVRVRDHGPGVPNDERDRLFTRFGRLAGSKMRSGRVGIGLGLYLGRRLARAMGGELDRLDSGPMGSTFRIQIPAPPWEES